MDERYNKAFANQRITTGAYYIFSYVKLLLNFNKII